MQLIQIIRGKGKVRWFICREICFRVRRGWMIFCDLCLRDFANHPFIIPFSCFTLSFKLHYDWHDDHNKLLSISDNSPSFLIHGVSFVVGWRNESFTTTAQQQREQYSLTVGTITATAGTIIASATIITIMIKARAGTTTSIITARAGMITQI